jgi:hypothetical protein
LWNLSELKKEFWGFLHYAGPPTISYALDAAVEIVALTYIAKIGERELAAAGLAFMLSNMTGHAVYTGMSTALGTIGSQAYGAQKYYLVGNILQQSLLVVALTLLPIAILWYFAGALFALSGIAPEIAVIAGSIIRLQILTLPPMALLQLIKVCVCVCVCVCVWVCPERQVIQRPTSELLYVYTCVCVCVCVCACVRVCYYICVLIIVYCRGATIYVSSY